MHELLLMRHAAAAFPARGVADPDRPLNARGEEQARVVGMWMAAHGLGPDNVLCSSAHRARKTAALVLASLPHPPPVTILDAIYGATSGELLACLDRCGTGERILLVGHNPGIQDLVAILCPVPPSYRGMPPAALAHVVLHGSLDPGHGTLETLRIP